MRSNNNTWPNTRDTECTVDKPQRRHTPHVKLIFLSESKHQAMLNYSIIWISRTGFIFPGKWWRVHFCVTEGTLLSILYLIISLNPYNSPKRWCFVLPMDYRKEAQDLSYLLKVIQLWGWNSSPGGPTLSLHSQSLLSQDCLCFAWHRSLLRWGHPAGLGAKFRDEQCKGCHSDCHWGSWWDRLTL